MRRVQFCPAGLTLKRSTPFLSVRDVYLTGSVPIFLPAYQKSPLFRLINELHATMEVGSCHIVYASDAESLVFDWGTIRILSEPAFAGGGTMTFAEVTVRPGMGHARHKHGHADEVIYVIEGEALQMLEDKPPVVVRTGASIYVPRGVFHGTKNVGSGTLKLIVVYAPAGEEQILRALPGVRIEPAGR